jgi:hypothetical protein
MTNIQPLLEILQLHSSTPFLKKTSTNPNLVLFDNNVMDRVA